MKIPVEISEENLTLEVTTRCTSSCRHCFARAGRGHTHELSEKTAQLILKEGYELGFRYLHLTGGEPLLWPLLFDFMEEALQMGFKNIFLNSNGHLLDDSAAEKCGALGDNVQLSISLQGPEEHHDSFRGIGSYQKAIKGIRAALKAEIALHIFTTVDRGMLPLLPRFVDDACREFSEIKSHTLIQLVRVHADILDLKNDLLSPEDFISMVKMGSFLRLPGHPVTFLENPLAVTATRLMGIEWLPPSKPLHRTGRLVILADGTITLAHSTRDSFGSWKPGILKSVITSEEYDKATDEDQESCAGCPYIAACRASGMLRPSEWFRDMEQESYCRRVLDLITRDTSKE